MDNKIRELPSEERVHLKHRSAAEKQLEDIKFIMQLNSQKTFNDLSVSEVQSNLQNIGRDDSVYAIMDEESDLKIKKIVHQGQVSNRFWAGVSIGPIVYMGMLLKDQTPKYRAVLFACIPLVYLRFHRYEIARIESEIN